jgi:hypothetical protein
MLALADVHIHLYRAQSIHRALRTVLGQARAAHEAAVQLQVLGMLSIRRVIDSDPQNSLN